MSLVCSLLRIGKERVAYATIIDSLSRRLRARLLTAASWEVAHESATVQLRIMVGAI